MANLTVPPYRAALLTGADGAPMVRANGPDSELVMTDRQWYMFWQNVAAQINAGSQAIDSLEGLVTFGNHADRPDPGPWPDGALYIEQDRGSVLYQNQGGTWVYIAGIMYGTLVPDQRPADLGPAADAGFQFRTTTDPARAFTWNGGQWVETTPIRYGTHAARLAAPIANLVSGMLWMETDRGSVIYQNQGGTWLFLTGTMWDTMSPDHRPTDLGVHDAGFDYRSTDPPPREFIWNQTAWVETTPLVDPTTTKGDLIARGSTAPATRLPVGSNGQVLTADSALALGVKWAAAASGPAQTPWLSDINAGGFKLTNLDTISPVASGTLKFRQGTDMNLWLRPHQNLATGVYFQALNDVATVFQGLQIDCSTLALNAGSAGPVGIAMSGPTFNLQIGADSAAKPTTSTWSVVSDLRLKQNMEPVKTDSLAILDKLDWIRYEYNGQASTPKGARGIGLVAQALREQLPEAVRSTRTKLNETDAEETDVLAIDYHYVLVHSARAIQQLSAEVKRLGSLIEKPA